MKKAKCAIVTYKNNWIYEMLIQNCKGDFIRLIGYDPVDIEHPYKYQTYKIMLDSIVNICKSNGYSLEYKKMYDNKFYNIVLIDLDDKKGTLIHTIAWG